MECIFDSIILNKCYGKECLLSEAIVDLVRIYTYFLCDNSNEDVSKHLDAMVEEIGNSQAVDNLRRNLLEVHFKMRHRVQDKLINFLGLLIYIP